MSSSNVLKLVHLNSHSKTLKWQYWQSAIVVHTLLFWVQSNIHNCLWSWRCPHKATYLKWCKVFQEDYHETLTIPCHQPLNLWIIHIEDKVIHSMKVARLFLRVSNIFLWFNHIKLNVVTQLQPNLNRKFWFISSVHIQNDMDIACQCQIHINVPFSFCFYPKWEITTIHRNFWELHQSTHNITKHNEHALLSI